jgi:hypothetical protein
MNKMRYYFFIAENNKSEILGFAQMSYAIDLKFCFLDLLANNSKRDTGGIGGALYKRVRDEAIHLNASGLFIECMSDNPELFKDKSVLKQSRNRLKFYERFGAKPIVNPGFERESLLTYGNPYFLLFDNLGIKKGLSLQDSKKIFRAVLERKHNRDLNDKGVRKFISSMTDDPVVIRKPLYSKDDFNHYAFNVPADRKLKRVNFSLKVKLHVIQKNI